MIAIVVVVVVVVVIASVVVGDVVAVAVVVVVAIAIVVVIVVVVVVAVIVDAALSAITEFLMRRNQEQKTIRIIGIFFAQNFAAICCSRPLCNANPSHK